MLGIYIHKCYWVIPDWDMRGDSIELNEKWIRPIITKVLINIRWKLNALIDAERPKPAEVSPEQWNSLVRTRATDASRKRSEQMRTISKGKGAKALQLKALEKDAIIKLVKVFSPIICLYVNVHVQMK